MLLQGTGKNVSFGGRVRCISDDTDLTVELLGHREGTGLPWWLNGKE